MERVTLERLHADPELFERLAAQARRARADIVGACFASLHTVLARRVYNMRSSRGVAMERACSGKACSTANAS